MQVAVVVVEDYLMVQVLVVLVVVAMVVLVLVLLKMVEATLVVEEEVSPLTHKVVLVDLVL